jgi:hypothetical protein
METAKKVLVGVLVAIAAGIVLPAALVCILNLLGWRAAGVAVGSVASRIQAAIGNVTQRSVFAIAQSIAALGARPAILKFGFLCAIVGGVAYGIYSYTLPNK